jgi:hypothetical protein
MKAIKKNLKVAMLIFSICMGVLTFSSCSSDEEDSIVDDIACEQLECLNGGEAIVDIELKSCRCICPFGYTGENCEEEYCPPNIECPGGQAPNPANECRCE